MVPFVGHRVAIAMVAVILQAVLQRPCFCVLKVYGLDSSDLLFLCFEGIWFG